MVVLYHKALREIKDNIGVYVACILVIIIGLLAYTSMSIVLENLLRAQEDFYTETGFADGFIKLKGYPENEIDDLQKIPGIDTIEGRIVKDVRIHKESDQSSFLRLVSLDTVNPPELNQIQLVEGNLPAENKLEILVDPKFFAANHLKLGDSLTLILEGERKTFTIVGTAQSPEFIYAMRSAQELYPDPLKFGVSYISRNTLTAFTKESTMVNDIVFSLEDGANFEEVKEQLEEELKPYGVQSIIPRKNQTSHAILTSELNSLKGTAQSLPIVFLGVATIILYTMLWRLIEQQRTQIGTLKAFGFTNHEIILHYLSYPLFIGGLGGLLGGLAGIALSYPLTTLYKEFFALPGLNSTFSLKYLLLGLALSVLFSFLSGLKASLDILRLDPAEAMRPAAPQSAHKFRFEMLSWFWDKLSAQDQMGIRNVFRNPIRSLFTVFGLAVVFSLMTVTWSMQNMTDKLTTFQYEQVQTYDVKITLNNPVLTNPTYYALQHEPGVSRIEPLLEVPTTLKHDWYKKDIMMMGLTPNGTLYHILDQNEKRVPVPEQGILLSDRLAKLLHVQVGDILHVDSPYSRDLSSQKDQTLVVTGIVPQYVGLNAFMDIRSLQDFLHQGKISNSMLIEMETEEISALKAKYTEASAVASVESLKETSEKILEMVASYGFTIYFLAILAGFAGFALIYNSSIISLSERQRELASLRVLGMTPKEVLKVITSEQWLLCLFGIILGIPLSYLLMAAMAQALSTDLFSIPSEVPPIALMGAVGGTALSVWIAQGRTYRRICSLPFVEILATKE